ncbi:hypothetical protein GEMRC1_002416 [Eukaryota sp. GEM-RC1]
MELSSSSFSQPATRTTYLDDLPFTPMYFQQSLLVNIITNMLRILMKSTHFLDERCFYFGGLRKLLPCFLQKVAYVSQRFFESTLISVKVLLQTYTPSVDDDDVMTEFHQLFAFASFFNAEVNSVFLCLGLYREPDFSKYSHLITGLRLKRNTPHFDFLKPSSLLYLPRVRSLLYSYFSVNHQCFIAFAGALAVNDTITAIDLEYASLGNRGAITLASALKSNTTVTKIMLLANRITSKGALALSEALSVNVALTNIDLSSNPIGDQGAIAIANVLKTNSVIYEIGLGDNSIGVKGLKAVAEALKVNSKLVVLDLSYNQVSDEGVIAIGEALKLNSSIRLVDLSKNSISDEGALFLAESLTLNTTVTRISLLGNLIQNVHTRDIIKKKSNGRIIC